MITAWLDAFPTLINGLLLNVIILTYGSLQVIDGNLTLGGLIAMQMLGGLLIVPVQQIVMLARMLQTTRADLARVSDVLHYPEDPTLQIGAEAKSQDSSGESVLPERLTGRVEFRSVQFGYDLTAPAILDEISFEADSGARIAVVGGTGSGKSSVANLLLGLNLPWAGEILLDGKPLADVPAQQRVNSISGVNQEVTIFRGSIRENVTMWDSTISDDLVIRAIHDASCSELIERPGGLDAVLQGRRTKPQRRPEATTRNRPLPRTQSNRPGPRWRDLRPRLEDGGAHRRTASSQRLHLAGRFQSSQLDSRRRRDSGPRWRRHLRTRHPRRTPRPEGRLSPSGRGGWHMTTTDHPAFDSDALGAALEISASAHELPPSVRAITVQSGMVYLFARRRRETEFSAQSHVLEMAAGSILVLPEHSEPSIQFRISGAPSTVARGLGQDAAEALLASSEAVDRINALCDTLTNETSETTPSEGEPTVATVGVELELEPGDSLVATSADQPATWIFEEEGREVIARPITSCAALTIAGPRRVMPCDTATAVERLTPAGMVDFLSNLLLDFADQRIRLEDLAFGQRVLASERADASRVDATAYAVADGITFGHTTPRSVNASSGFDAACRRVVSELGVTIENQITYQQNTARSPIEQFARAARVQTREVTLDSGWWQNDCGHLLGWGRRRTDSRGADPRRPRIRRLPVP